MTRTVRNVPLLMLALAALSLAATGCTFKNETSTTASTASDTAAAAEACADNVGAEAHTADTADARAAAMTALSVLCHDVDGQDGDEMIVTLGEQSGAGITAWSLFRIDDDVWSRSYTRFSTTEIESVEPAGDPFVNDLREFAVSPRYVAEGEDVGDGQIRDPHIRRFSWDGSEMAVTLHNDCSNVDYQPVLDAIGEEFGLDTLICADFTRNGEYDVLIPRYAEGARRLDSWTLWTSDGTNWTVGPAGEPAEGVNSVTFDSTNGSMLIVESRADLAGDASKSRNIRALQWTPTGLDELASPPAENEHPAGELTMCDLEWEDGPFIWVQATVGIDCGASQAVVEASLGKGRAPTGDADAEHLLVVDGEDTWECLADVTFWESVYSHCTDGARHIYWGAGV